MLLKLLAVLLAFCVAGGLGLLVGWLAVYLRDMVEKRRKRTEGENG